MKITVSGKNMEITPALRGAVEKKLSKLERFFNPNVEAHVTFSVEKNKSLQKSKQVIEVTIPFNGVILRGEEATEDMYASIDLVVDKLESQIRKQKTKLERKTHGDSLRYQYIPDVEEDTKNELQIVRTKRFAIKPMSSEEAVLQMELLGHSFFVFKDSDSEEVNVVYKRKDGNYGLIEPEF
ncbi:MAG: ribosome hibernation-promoting factor, HPF/YfiA family [Solirubrobacterales bacterium]